MSDVAEATATVARVGAAPVDRADARLRAAMVALTAIGLGIAGYLTYIHYAGIAPVCAINGGCEKVQSSRYAEIVGVPVALIGLLGYTAIGATLFVPGDRGRLAGAFLTLGGLAFSLYLTYLELFQIKAICQWCVGSAVVMTALTALAFRRALRVDPD